MYEKLVIKNIRKKLRETGVKHKVIAERAGLSQQSFSDILNQRKIITAEHIGVIAKALDVEVNDLYASDEVDNVSPMDFVEDEKGA